MNVNKTSTCLALAVLLSACGGTSGSGGSSDGLGDGSTEVRSTADLQTTAEFELKSTEALELEVSVAALADERAYLYVCQKKDTSTLNYDRCLVKTPMSGGQYSGTFTLGNDIETLGLEVWTYDPADDPDQHSWSRSVHGMNWTVSL